MRIHRSCKNIILIFMVIITSMIFSACEPTGNLKIENQFGQDVKIYYTHVFADGTLDKATYEGTIQSNTTKSLSITFLGSKWIQRVEAVDSFGNIIFSHDYIMADLAKMGWKIAITP